jgi:hypothetical protein
MVVSRHPFSLAARIVAWLLAGICVIGGSLGLVLGIVSGQVVLVLAAAGVCGLGVFYAGAAWRARPWHWR